MRKDLLPGEQVITVTRPQPRKLFVPGLLFIVAPALGAFASAWIVRGGPAGLVPLITADWTLWLVAVCAGGVAWILLGYCLPRVLKWHATQYVLTSRRIVARYGMLRRRDMQISLASVQNVGVSQSVWQRILRSGNISLDTGHGAEAVIPDVPEAVKFRNFVLDAIDELPAVVIFEADRAQEFDGRAGYYRPQGRGETWDTREGGTDER